MIATNLRRYIINWFGGKALPTDELPQGRPRKPESYQCPHCGAGVTAQYLYQGGILGTLADRPVKAKIICLRCGRQNAFAGRSPYHRGTILVLLNQPRRRMGERKRLYRNANVTA